MSPGIGLVKEVAPSAVPNLEWEHVDAAHDHQRAAVRARCPVSIEASTAGVSTPTLMERTAKPGPTFSIFLPMARLALSNAHRASAHAWAISAASRVICMLDLGNSFPSTNLPIGMRGSVVYSAAPIEPSAIR